MPASSYTRFMFGSAALFNFGAAALCRASRDGSSGVTVGWLRRYSGTLAASLLLTLLFGISHWWPLRRRPV